MLKPSVLMAATLLFVLSAGIVRADAKQVLVVEAKPQLQKGKIARGAIGLARLLGRGARAAGRVAKGAGRVVKGAGRAVVITGKVVKPGRRAAWLARSTARGVGKAARGIGRAVRFGLGNVFRPFKKRIIIVP